MLMMQKRTLRHVCLISKPEMAEGFLYCYAIVWTDLEAFQDEVLDVGAFVRQLFPVAIPKWNRPNSINIILDLRRLVRHAELVQDHSESPHVDFRPDQNVGTLDFGGYVPRRPTPYLHDGLVEPLELVRGRNHRNSEVADFDCRKGVGVVEFAGHEQIRELEVRVNYVVLMKLLNASQDLLGNALEQLLVLDLLLLLADRPLQELGIVAILQVRDDLVLRLGVVVQFGYVFVVQHLMDGVFVSGVEQLLVGK